jgi:hypothetical protein
MDGEYQFSHRANIRHLLYFRWKITPTWPVAGRTMPNRVRKPFVPEKALRPRKRLIGIISTKRELVEGANFYFRDMERYRDMERPPFVFSGRWNYRLARHLAFWLALYFGQASMMTAVPGLIGSLGDNTFVEFFLVPVLYLPGQLMMVYLLLYRILPRFILMILSGRHKLALLWVTILTVCSAAVSAVCYDALINTVRAHFFIFRYFQFEPQGFSDQFPFAFSSSLRAVLIVAGFAAAIKLMKHWYEKEYLNQMLQKEKLDAELQSLKAQVHPHFLFNTLNNIYSMTEKVDSPASETVMKLSGLLRYMLYECNRPLVSLDQEMKLIGDYIALERIRYDHLDLSIQLPEETTGYQIAPLLLLPLIENCFKHGTSRVLEQPWIRIDATMKSETLLVKLINGQPPGPAGGGFVEGLGLRNVRKRLNLLYPGIHEFTIVSEGDTFVVNCKIELNGHNH